MSILSIQEILDYINQARTNPKKFSQYIKKELDSFLDNRSLPLKKNCTYSTNQGKSAWKQAYDFVKNHKPLLPLQLNQGLNLAAMDHAIDMKNNNFFDHSSSNGMSMSQRIVRRCGESYGGCAQNLGSQFDVEGRNYPLQTIMGLIIDDGVPNRGHRNTIFSDKYKYVGIYAVKVGNKYYTCIDYHSENLKTIQPSKSPLVAKEKPHSNNIGKKPQQFVSSQGDFEKEFEKMKIYKGKDDNDDGWSTNAVSNKGQKYVTSKNTSTKTSTTNGKTVKVTTTKIKYSDGSTEQNIEEQRY